MVKVRSLLAAAALLAVCFAGARAAEEASGRAALRVYEVGKRVKDFPKKQDFSTPEAAYATINRLQATGTGNWREVCSSRINRQSPPGPRDKMSPPSEDYATTLRNAEIVEVRTLRDTISLVAARFTPVKTPMSRPIDCRWFVLEDGRWAIARLSGTEPLVRLYAEAEDRGRVDALLGDLRTLLGV